MLLFCPNRVDAEQLARTLRYHAHQVMVAADAADALRAVTHQSFRLLIVGADLNDRECVRYLGLLRRKAPRSWLLVTTKPVSLRLELRARRRGVDALIDAADGGEELTRRVAQLLVRSRPAY